MLVVAPALSGHDDDRCLADMAALAMMVAMADRQDDAAAQRQREQRHGSELQGA